MDSYSYLSNGDTSWFDNLYKEYKSNPDGVEESWKKFFEGFEFSLERYGEDSGGEMPKEFKVINLINDYRSRGHLFTKTNPVRERREYQPGITLEQHDLSPADLDQEFEAGKEVGLGRAKLRDIIDNLDKVYCQSIGVEYTYMRNPE
ncbi:MAG: 2-oxoglutarate dehydrogenase E1 component, partial [Sphingobacteriales bacterium]